MRFLPSYPDSTASPDTCIWPGSCLSRAVVPDQPLGFPTRILRPTFSMTLLRLVLPSRRRKYRHSSRWTRLSGRMILRLTCSWCSVLSRGCGLVSKVMAMLNGYSTTREPSWRYDTFISDLSVRECSHIWIC